MPQAPDEARQPGPDQQKPQPGQPGSPAAPGGQAGPGKPAAPSKPGPGGPTGPPAGGDPGWIFFSVGGDLGGVRMARVRDAQDQVFDVPLDRVSAIGREGDPRPGERVEIDGDPKQLAVEAAEERCKQLESELEELRGAREDAQAELAEAIANSPEAKRDALRTIESDIGWRERQIETLKGFGRHPTMAAPGAAATDPVKLDALQRCTERELRGAAARLRGDPRGWFGLDVLATCQPAEIDAELMRRGHRA